MTKYQQVIDKMLDYICIREDVINKERINNSISITDLSFHCQLFELAKMKDAIYRITMEMKDDD